MFVFLYFSCERDGARCSLYVYLYLWCFLSGFSCRYIYIYIFSIFVRVECLYAKVSVRVCSRLFVHEYG